MTAPERFADSQILFTPRAPSMTQLPSSLTIYRPSALIF
jgi:hypothetical protein